jgi:hypothetical protein
MRAPPRAHLETRLGAARQRVGADQTREEEKTGRRVFLRGQNEAARGGKIIDFHGPNLADHGGRRPAFQRLFHGPERLFGARRMNEKEAIRIEPMKGEPRPIKRALFQAGEILADPDDRPAPARRAQTGGKGERKTCRRGMIAGLRRDDLVKRAEPEAAGEHAIEACVTERNASRKRRLVRRA